MMDMRKMDIIKRLREYMDTSNGEGSWRVYTSSQLEDSIGEFIISQLKDRGIEKRGKLLRSERVKSLPTHMWLINEDGAIIYRMGDTNGCGYDKDGNRIEYDNISFDKGWRVATKSEINTYA
jgi:hypothetical protein